MQKAFNDITLVLRLQTNVMFFMALLSPKIIVHKMLPIYNCKTVNYWQSVRKKSCIL